MNTMGKVIIKIPLVTWREGRPRFFASAVHRQLGFKGEDLRHPDGRWYSVDEAVAWSEAKQKEIASCRAAIAGGETTARKTRNAAERARRDGLVTIGQVCETFVASPRMQGREIVQGRKKRPPLADNTIRFYRGASRLLEGFDQGRVWNEAAAALTPRALAGILDKIEIRHGLAQARAVRAFLSVAYGHGRKQHLVAHNPVEGLEETLPVLEERVRPASVAEFEHLIAVADALGQPDFADVVCAGPWTGQRQNDRLSLPADRISGEGLMFSPSKKRAVRQNLLIPLAGRLEARLAAARARRKAWTVVPTTLFVCERTGRPWAADWYRKVFRVLRQVAATGDIERDQAGAVTKDAATLLAGVDVPAVLAAAGLPAMPSIATLRDQDLRDTCMSWLALAGCDRFEIAGFSGHAFGQSDKVLRHYVAIPPEFARRGMEKLEGWYARQAQEAGQEAKG
ncbi:hypothetical protein [Nitratireductor indicus]|nr:hypothetical protein [Nitratireductor indicus]SFQ10615.1 hypothetical protein SAMN05216176_101370 [Nitratireductor indicus]